MPGARCRMAVAPAAPSGDSVSRFTLNAEPKKMGTRTAFAPLAELPDVHLRHDERDLRIETEAAADVDHRRARRRGARRMLARDARPGREEGQLHAVEGLRREERDLLLAPGELDLGTRR